VSKNFVNRGGSRARGGLAVARRAWLANREAPVAFRPANERRLPPSPPVTAFSEPPGSPGLVALTAARTAGVATFSAHTRLPWVLAGCSLVAVWVFVRFTRRFQLFGEVG